ncbi:MAG: hypothetical protein J0G95_03540 [Rhizobiales bacterium]|nr:hypothetical protein [Hyphomicrobiales bacterium]
MNLRRIIPVLTGLAATAAALALLLPQARQAGALLLAQDDPAQLSDLRLDVALGSADGGRAGAVIEQNVAQALAQGDADLADSFVALAHERGVSIAPVVSEQVAAARAEHNSASSYTRRFARGLVTGEIEDGASLSGTLAGDLFVFGDIRDAVREGKRLVTGEEADRLVLGLAGVGLAVTAASYVSAGGAMPLRAGLSLVKDARKAGRLGTGLSAWTGRAARDVVDTPMLRQAVERVSLTRPGETAWAIKAAFRAEKAGALVRLAKDVGRIGEKAGTKGALDVLRIADGPKDVARAARLAESKGGQTRAIVKLLGRGAVLGLTGLFNLAWWVFAALLALIGLLTSIKATTERLTWWWLRRAKRKRARRILAQAQSGAA